MATELGRGGRLTGGGRVPAPPRGRTPTVARGLRVLLALIVGVLVYTALAGALEVLLDIERPTTPDGGGKLTAALRPGPYLVLREEGIDYRRAGFLVPWSEVGGASLHPLYPIEYVRLDVRDPERYLETVEISPLLELLAGGRTVRAKELGIALLGAPVTAEELCELIRSRARLHRG